MLPPSACKLRDEITHGAQTFNIKKIDLHIVSQSEHGEKLLYSYN